MSYDELSGYVGYFQNAFIKKFINFDLSSTGVGLLFRLESLTSNKDGSTGYPG